MRGIKVGLTTAVVVAVAALSIGAGSAAATTTICETNSAPLPCASPYPNASSFVVGGQAAFESSSSGFTCLFEYEFQLGVNKKPVVAARVQSWEWSGCTGGHTVSSLNLPTWPLSLITTGSGPNGTGEMEPWLEQPFEIDSCVYEAPVIPLTIQGGGYITVSGTGMLLASGPCPIEFTMAISAAKPTPQFWMTN